MDFDERPDEAAFRAEVRAFLAAHARERTGDEEISVGFSERAGTEDELVHVRESQAWQALLYDNGWAGITWPTEYGGRGQTIVEQMIFNQELARFVVPGSVFAQGIGMAGPTLLAYGSPEQKDRFLRPMLRGDELWCQLFSEPNAGSDLASLRTRADRDGDEYVVNGQKVWTSSAHYADWGILLARTDWDVPKHKGITYFLVDMRTPGIEVRPLRQINGGAHFNEVFLSDVRIPSAHVVGRENAGWMVTHATLANERTLIGGGGMNTMGVIDRLVHRYGGLDDPVLRDEYVSCLIAHRLVTFLGWRVQSAVLQGRVPGPESSVLKLAHTRHLARVADLGVRVAGAAGTLNEPDLAEAHNAVQLLLGQFSSRIGGGTDEVQRNIVGERVLGLPGDPRNDKDVPFRDHPF